MEAFCGNATLHISGSLWVICPLVTFCGGSARGFLPARVWSGMKPLLSQKSEKPVPSIPRISARVTKEAKAFQTRLDRAWSSLV